jgi:hypothetical protein
MALLFDRLHNHVPTQNAFLADAKQAIEAFDLTAHERDAVLTRDCDDLVAIGLAQTTAGLPDVLGCPGVPQLSNDILERLRRVLAEVVQPLRRIPERLPDLPVPGFPRRPVPPRPEPRPGPDPPGPTPGPDPPGPDGPGRANRPGPRG